VVIDGVVSKCYDVISGVPQGSVLGPLLFILFINDVVTIFNDDVSCKLFADDLKFYSVIDNEGINNPIKSALEQLYIWSSKWQLEINSSKCKSLHLGKKNPDFEYSLNNVIFESVNHIRDLGVEVDDCLRFDEHIKIITKRAYQRLGVLFRGFVSKNESLLTMAYKVYIRPLLEYCSEIWSPFLLKDIDAIESEQRYFTRRINRIKALTYKEILNIESLEVRRIKRDLVMCYKIVNNLIDLQCERFFKFLSISTRGHSFKIVKPPLVKNNLALNLFQYRVVEYWN